VTFSGVDISRNEIGREAVLGYLRTVAPDWLAATETLFAALAGEEAKWLLRIDDASKQTLVQLLPQLQAVIDHLTANKDGFVRRSSLRAFDQALQYTRVMKQFIMANATDLLPPSHYTGTDGRDLCMAENLIALADQARPDAKCIIWAHNWHISVSEEPNIGSYLRAKYGSAYFAFGFEFNQGSFQTRIVLPDKLLGDLQEVTLPPAPTASLAWYLSRINRDVSIVNLRAPVSNPVIEAWIDTPQAAHGAGWLYDAAAHDYLYPLSIRVYDGIIFLEHTTASRPTANALNTIAQRDGL
jgi:erythromycin esterase